MALKDFKDKVDTAQAIVTIFAIIVGGIWTYNLFIKERRHYPHVNIEHKASHIVLSKDINLLRLEIGLTNTGNSRLIQKKSIIRVQQILPIVSSETVNQINDFFKQAEMKEDRFTWPLLYEREKFFDSPLEIEPGEKDVIDFEFVIPSKVKVIRLYTYFRNEKKSKAKDEIGWNISSYYDFRKVKKEGAK